MWRRIPASALFLAPVYPSTTQAQWRMPWANEAFGEPPGPRYERPSPDPRLQPPVAGNSIRDGGARPQIEPQAPAVVAFPNDYPAASIVIDTSGRMLYYVLGNNQDYVLGNNQAYAYPISVGREGFNWTGTETIGRKQAWPDWHPPEEMRQRDPKLPEKLTGACATRWARWPSTSARPSIASMAPMTPNPLGRRSPRDAFG